MIYSHTHAHTCAYSFRNTFMRYYTYFRDTIHNTLAGMKMCAFIAIFSVVVDKFGYNWFCLVIWHLPSIILDLKNPAANTHQIRNCISFLLNARLY